MIKLIITVLGVSCLAGVACPQSAPPSTTPEASCLAQGMTAGAPTYTDCVSKTRRELNDKTLAAYLAAQARIQSEVTIVAHTSGADSPEALCASQGNEPGTAAFNSCVGEARQTLNQTSSTYSSEMSNAQMQSSPIGQGVAH